MLDRSSIIKEDVTRRRRPFLGGFLTRKLAYSYGAGLSFQRAAAARFAMSERSSGLKAAARARPPLSPPFRPSATAAGFFRRLWGALSVASATTRAASWLTSGVFLILERLGIFVH